MTPALILISIISLTQSQYNGKLPNIVFMLTDDLGWNSMYNNQEDISPTLDAMVGTSLKMTSFYVYKYCAPTRGSFLTGRFPYKLAATRNNLNPPYIPEGTNLGYTMIAEKLKSAPTPYISYQVGKWHQGVLSSDYTPIGRGFNKSYGFLGGGEDHYKQTGYEMNCNYSANFHAVDYYDCDKPAYGKNGTYNGYLFTAKAITYIQDHVKENADRPFFLYFALHNTHSPFEAPQKYVSMYKFNQTLRNTFDAMTSVVDESVKNVTDILKALKLWDNTLFVWTTDNGAPVSAGGSNAPFRGSKGNNFEGGVHVPLLVTGGVLPDSMKGKTLDGMMHITDWYATFCHLAGGINPNDDNPDAPSPIDSLNFWPYLTGQVAESPRNLIVHDHRMYTSPTEGAIRNGKYKLVMMNESQAGWYGQFSPNTSWNKNMVNIYACSVDKPCLFDIEADVTEHNDISSENPDVVKQMVELFNSFDDEYHPPKNHPTPEEEAFCGAAQAAGEFAVPWQKSTK